MNRNGKIIALVALTTVLAVTAAKRQARAWAPPALRQDLNGLRLKGDGSAQYLMGRGCRRHIPDIATRDRIFRYDRYQYFPDIDQITECQPISTDAFLARATGRREVFLIDDGTKRGVTSPQVMDKYGFDFNKVQPVSPPMLLDYVPSGEDIY